MAGLSPDGLRYFLNDIPDIFPIEPVDLRYNPTLQGLLGLRGGDTLTGSADSHTIYCGKDNDLISGEAGNAGWSILPGSDNLSSDWPVPRNKVRFRCGSTKTTI
ncbi:MAG: hypothetical protein F6K40_02005 [Okeania sp. SIO3I5]|uniref:hypothetical protein n=1 Tax=Okeania sp. SIO3I5 TaxID=2607805 RepID=UPI0013BE564B|nr:hypothetical protein [Okeania sp. SIO3I5]NEQ35147.1 hypothetical protein [Okeania sp. SIO3I5]